MIGRRPRSLSQHSYSLIQQIHAENDRQRQVDRGLGYRAFATERWQKLLGRADTIDVSRPLHVGPQIEMVRRGEGFEAA